MAEELTPGDNADRTRNRTRNLGGRPTGDRTITLFHRGESKVYSFHAWVNGRRITRGTRETNQERAMVKARQIVARLAEPDAPNPDMLLKDFTADFFVWGKCPWIASQEAAGHPFSQGSAMARRIQLTKWILPRFGKRPLRSLTAKELRDWINSLTYSSQSKRHLYYTLKIVLDEAVLGQHIERNPVKDFGLVKLSRKERDPFLLSDLALLFPVDTGELLRIWKHAEHATLFMVLAACGLRSGEVRALAWKHILGPVAVAGVDRYFLLVEQAVKFATGRTIGTTKAGKARPVYLPDRARGALDWWRPNCEWTEPGDLIFPSEARGRPMSGQVLIDRLKGALERAGVDTKGRALVPHSFRHAYVTRGKRTLPADLLLLMAGHADEKTQAGYVHTRLEDQLLQIGEQAGTIEGIWPRQSGDS